MSAATFSASRFDGRTAMGAPVTVAVDGGNLLVRSPEGALLQREPLQRALVSEAFEQAPRMIALPDGSTLEVSDPDRRFADELQLAGWRPSLVVRLQAYLPGVIMALALLVAAMAAAYVVGLPAAARWAAFALPAGVEQRMGSEVLSVLDEHYFHSSKLAKDRQAAIRERFQLAVAGFHPDIHCRLEFRSLGDSVNAFTLPGGTIVLLDGLVEFADDVDVVMGVLGHELGHALHRHGTRQALQSLGLGALAGLMWGDFSGALSSVPALLGVLNYSRDFEREADAFAVDFLESQHLSAEPLDRFFTRLQQKAAREGEGEVPEFLSSHPPTDERVERLRRPIK